MSGPVVGYVLRMFPQRSETFIANEVLELERRGARVRVYSYRRPVEQVEHASVRAIRAPVVYLPERIDRVTLARARSELLELGADPGLWSRTADACLDAALRERDGDALCRLAQATVIAADARRHGVGHLHAHFAHGATRVAMLAGGLADLPFTFTAHARDIYSHDVDHALLAEKLERSRFGVTVCDFNRRHVGERAGRRAAARLRTLYNGVDLDKFSPGSEAERDDVLILGVGRFVEKKGFANLVDACRLLRDRDVAFRCLLVGEGELREALERQIADARLGDRVTIAGPRSQEELPALYRRASVLAMPAIEGRDGNRDALPTVLLEAAACGTPAVASRVTGIPEIVEDGRTGLVVEPGDVAALASALERVLGDTALRARFGLGARERAVERFDLRRNAGRLWEMIVAEARAPVAGDDDAVRLSLV